MDRLPVEILEQIFVKLELLYIYRCESVCHRWYKIINTENFWLQLKDEESLLTGQYIIKPVVYYKSNKAKERIINADAEKTIIKIINDIFDGIISGRYLVHTPTDADLKKYLGKSYPISRERHGVDINDQALHDIMIAYPASHHRQVNFLLQTFYAWKGWPRIRYSTDKDCLIQNLIEAYYYPNRLLGDLRRNNIKCPPVGYIIPNNNENITN